MADYAESRAAAAKWIYERRGRVKWWRWSVLTVNNPDREALRLDPETAFLIFSDLHQAGLFLPVIADDGREASTINPGKEDQWRQVMNPRWHVVQQSGWRMGEWVISGVIGAILGVIASKIFG